MNGVTAALYNQEILRLAASVPFDARLADPHASAERRSPVCGSRVTVDVRLDPDGRVSELGMLVRACALGQASSALMARHAPGKSLTELTTARDTLAAWLDGEGSPPDWPGLELFEPARPHTARHASIRLAFEAVAEAVSEAQAKVPVG